MWVCRSLPSKMNHGTINTIKVLPTAKPKALRARSLPSSRPFSVAAFFSALHYFGLITTATAFVLFLSEPSQLASKVIVGGLAFSGVTWMIAFFKRRCAYCPLCKGTPMINSGALAHSRASRIYPFNHGVSATLSIIATQTFRCMYCGSDFDLLKKPSYQRSKQSGNCTE